MQYANAFIIPTQLIRALLFPTDITAYKEERSTLASHAQDTPAPRAKALNDTLMQILVMGQVARAQVGMPTVVFEDTEPNFWSAWMFWR